MNDQNLVNAPFWFICSYKTIPPINQTNSSLLHWRLTFYPLPKYMHGSPNPIPNMASALANWKKFNKLHVQKMLKSCLWIIRCLRHKNGT